MVCFRCLWHFIYAFLTFCGKSDNILGAWSYRLFLLLEHQGAFRPKGKSKKGLVPKKSQEEGLKY